jgi:polar amino acid transport system substrate-binding protein
VRRGGRRQGGSIGEPGPRRKAHVSNKYYLLVRKDASVRQLSDFEDKEGLRLGVIRSFRYSENANRFVDKL